MLRDEQKGFLYKLIEKALSHGVKTEEVFFEISQEGPAVFKEHCSKAAIDIKKNRTFSESGKRNGIFNHFESKIVTQAIESNRLVRCFNLLIDYYNLRNSHQQTPFVWMAPWAFLVLTAIVIHGMPDLFLHDQSTTTYVLKTMLMCVLFTGLMRIISNTHGFLSSQLTKLIGIHKLLMSLPQTKYAHTQKQITTFTESVGIAKLCGMNWIEATELSLQRVTNPLVHEDLKNILTRMQRQDKFEDALKACEFFPEEYIKELEAAADQKELPKTLIKFKEKHIIATEHRLESNAKNPVIIMILIAIGLLLHAAFKAGVLQMF